VPWNISARAVIASTAGRGTEDRKNLLFLKKKKQKDFPPVPLTRRRRRRCRNRQKFFGSFFQKRTILIVPL
jgi:hypothetical protein